MKSLGPGTTWKRPVCAMKQVEEAASTDEDGRVGGDGRGLEPNHNGENTRLVQRLLLRRWLGVGGARNLAALGLVGAKETTAFHVVNQLDQWSLRFRARGGG
eukprot:CAMPEP_0175994266 /NCGR_PEP_ID=MMETSP0108-20121206/54476_1 /TAXON_ID=195067 ORGANISM="Goniomonas pacifica, Strain CCMP1869" /NCGR_SAMPLE_ID=MMETSP0108 /ASSEMBLY_ACC=CAM_ASM_000204 /LENGTH=101 /DNA_ID=CAMNT_0017326249 /DNA_START=70 /DNA_END=373 /DNA_ORIENTATION=-